MKLINFKLYIIEKNGCKGILFLLEENKMLDIISMITTIWLTQDVMDRLDEMTKTDDSKSRSEFIERAIKFYDGYNRSTLENQYLPVAISSAVQGTVKSSEDRISKLLYKNTVELSMVMNVLSAIADVDNDTLKKLRVKCMNEVKATNGKISFEEINKYQKGS